MAGAAILVSSSLVAASPNTPETKAFNALVAEGYEVKAVTLVPLEVAKREQANLNADAVAVTLQKGGSVAVCYFGFGNWIALNKASLANPAQCAVS